MKLWIPEVFGFDGRNRQPPRDPFNALLSLGYTVLYAHMETVLRVSGLLPWVGFYHHEHLCDQNLVLIAWIRGKIPEFKAWRMR